ncbi:hypothetical protein PSU4_39240 [Pseudonocardia sulfidoxydans NBRC 16205]|uniref:TIGR04222 domain-containing membrane protein n=1 Tax=Pseudonocardia sulfidoxydans NBRC 16205 TaxID=1223511 RepID=A0A511DJI4_9PSEU|nr:TIGR04222 domain-containing membrane protein [Pseudonocardia sulfidoxydans]GEL24970.1 hypothetical protein PSU4_39240 [Pseudonocardia sulfidoxydans NBRC 16205]
MRPLAAAGDTWGISSQTFILFYLLLAVVVWIAAVRTRRAVVGRRRGDRLSVDLTSAPYDVAFLNGGADLAVFAALSSMRVDKTVATAGRGNVVAAGTLRADADPLEKAIHRTASSPVARARLKRHKPVVAALGRIEKRLVADGLLLDAGEQRAVRTAGAWMLAVAALGLLRIVAGIANGKPVGFMVAAFLVVSVIGIVLTARVPGRTPLGNSTVSMLRDLHDRLSPANNPDWVTYGAAGAALGVGVFGMSALWASDPAFASELEAQRAAASGGGDSGGGDGGGGAGGGCGGCGGGGGGGGCGG